MMTSSRIRSGLNSRAAIRPLRPRFSSRTSKSPVFSRLSLTIRVKLASSSMMSMRFFSITLNLEQQRDRHAAFGPITNIEVSAVKFHNFLCDGESQAGAFASRFGGEKRIENLREFVLGDPLARVQHLGRQHLFARAELLAEAPFLVGADIF